MNTLFTLLGYASAWLFILLGLLALKTGFFRSMKKQPDFYTHDNDEYPLGRR